MDLLNYPGTRVASDEQNRIPFLLVLTRPTAARQFPHHIGQLESYVLKKIYRHKIQKSRK